MAFAAMSRITWRRRIVTRDWGSAVSQSGSDRDPDWAVGDPLVRARLYRRHHPELASDAAAGRAVPRDRHAHPGRRFRRLGDTRNCTGRTAWLLSVLPAGCLSRRSNPHPARLERRYEFP